MANHVEYHTRILPRAFVFRHSPPRQRVGEKRKIKQEKIARLGNLASGLEKMQSLKELSYKNLPPQCKVLLGTIDITNKVESIENLNKCPHV